MKQSHTTYKYLFYKYIKQIKKMLGKYHIVQDWSWSLISHKELRLGNLYDYSSLSFHRVYFAEGSVHQEKMPDTRLKIPLGIRACYFLGDNVIIRVYCRYYTNDWSLKAHTVDLEISKNLAKKHVTNYK